MADRQKFRERFAKFNRTDDLGLSSKVGSSDSGRVLNKDGSANVTRIGGAINLYHWLISVKWSTFLLLIFALYMLANILFAGVYVLIGVDKISGIQGQCWYMDYAHAFFFSAQTLTTVGYGAMAPKGLVSSFVASMEAVIGLLSFSLATGLFYGRFVRPKSPMTFSNIAIVMPDQPFDKLMVRLANRYSHNLLNLEVSLLATMVVPDVNGLKRSYHTLTLENSKVVMLPLNWNVVHIINEESPLYQMSAADAEESQLELILLVNAHDESYGQVIYDRSSWRYTEIVRNARFKVPYYFDETGKTVFNLEMMDSYDLVNQLPEEVPVKA